MTFATAEADAWFLRNCNKLIAMEPSQDRVIDLMQMYRLRPASVLEVGCANGWRLNLLNELFDCVAVGIEPSVAAVVDGEKRYKNVQLILGTGDHIPFSRTDGSCGSFDCVILSFVLHCLDRSVLARTVAEVDRVTAQDGYIIIQDFAPDSFQRVPWHHQPGVWTYKHPDYGAMFASLGTYAEVARLTFDHDDGCKLKSNVLSERRGMVCLLQKQEGYPEAR